MFGGFAVIYQRTKTISYPTDNGSRLVADPAQAQQLPMFMAGSCEFVRLDIARTWWHEPALRQFMGRRNLAIQ